MGHVRFAEYAPPPPPNSPCSSATGDQAGAGRVAITQLAGSEDCSTIGVGEHRPCVAGRPYNRQGTLSCRTADAGNYVERDRILLRNGRSVASNGARDQSPKYHRSALARRRCATSASSRTHRGAMFALVGHRGLGYFERVDRVRKHPEIKSR
jgi:hypothetical protein